MARCPDEFYSGGLLALGYVWMYGKESVAETIVRDVGPYALLRVAKKSEDIYLSKLRRTVREVARVRRLRPGR